MTVSVSPFGPKPAFFGADGLPLVGGQLFFYVAGSVSTKQDTYTNSGGGVANTNPLILNSLGQPSTEVWFSDTATYKVVLAPAGDTDPPSSPIWSIDGLTGINAGGVASTVDEWLAQALTPTFISTVSFSLVGDQTTNFQPGRRVKAPVTAGTVYGTIATSVFGAVTTVTLDMDTGMVLDSGLSAVFLSILRADHQSLPEIQGTFTPTLTFATPGNLNVVYSSRVGTYTKIGNLVRATVGISCSTFTHTTASGLLHVTGLPFTAENWSGNIHAGSLVWTGITKATYTQITPVVNAGANLIAFQASGSGVNGADVTAADMPTAGTPGLRLTIIYQTT